MASGASEEGMDHRGLVEEALLVFSQGSCPLVQPYVGWWGAGDNFHQVPLLCLQKSSSLAPLGNSEMCLIRSHRKTLV